MSGSVKSGLICSLAALVATLALSFVPYVGIFCCGPLVALGFGMLAGYLGLRWSEVGAGIGQGILAGGIAGAGALLGSLLFFVVVLALLSGVPEFDQIVREALEQQAPGSQLTPEDIRNLMGFAGPVAGVCVGSFGLLFGLAGGALGAWLYRRRVMPAVPPVPPAAA